jgi:hypothetical protein
LTQSCEECGSAAERRYSRPSLGPVLAPLVVARLQQQRRVAPATSLERSPSAGARRRAFPPPARSMAASKPSSTGPAMSVAWLGWLERGLRRHVPSLPPYTNMYACPTYVLGTLCVCRDNNRLRGHSRSVRHTTLPTSRCVGCFILFFPIRH